MELLEGSLIKLFTHVGIILSNFTTVVNIISILILNVNQKFNSFQSSKIAEMTWSRWWRTEEKKTEKLQPVLKCQFLQYQLSPHFQLLWRYRN